MPIIEEVIQNLKRKNESLFGERLILWNGADFGIKMSGALYSEAAAFVGPSTGPTHLANLVGTPVLCFFSPIRVQSAMRWAPYYRDQNKLQVLVPNVVCGEEKKCAGESCPYFECMDRIEISDAKDRVLKLLEAGPKPGNVP